MTTPGPLDLLRELWSAGVEMPGSAKAILTTLILHRNAQSGACFPSITRISTEARVARRTVTAQLQALDDLGVLEIDRCQGRPNQYRLNLADLATRVRNALVQTGHWCKRDTGPVSHLPKTSANGTPELLSNYEGTTNNTLSASPRPVGWAFDLWNEVAHDCGLSPVKVGSNPATKKRTADLRKRIEQYSEDELRSVLTKPRRSAFLRGESGSWKGATFDWLLKPANFAKVSEGNYDDDDRPRAKGSKDSGESAWAPYFDADGNPKPWCKPWSMDDEMSHKDDPLWPKFEDVMLDWQLATPPPTFDEFKAKTEPDLQMRRKLSAEEIRDELVRQR